MSNMGSMLKVAKLAREYIKPSKPTPSHLKNFSLSFLDQLSPSVYAPMVFFYPSQGDGVQSSSRSHHLKNSLSDLLTRFHPFAGRIKDHMSIDCDDSGVEFTEAKADTSLNHVLNKPDVHVIKRFIPIDLESEETKHGTNQQLVHVQSSTLECGGTVIGVCWNHKLADACTASVFMKGWSLAARGLARELVPHYKASSLFPPMSSSLARKALKLDMEKTVTRRFVFGGAKIAALKALAAGPSVTRPTRVEAVSSLVWKCATKASREAQTRFQPVSVMSQSVNIRGRTEPPLPISTIGNLVGFYLSQMEQGDQDMDLASLVAKQRQGKAEIANDYVKKLQGKGEDRVMAIRELFKEATGLLSRDDVEFFKCMSVSGDGLYDLDFGWGKPVWSSVVTLGYKNTIVLNQTREGDGIEAWVTLTEDVMGWFERDNELLEFASSNPSAAQLGDYCACWKQVMGSLNPKTKEPVNCYCYNLACNNAS